MNLLGLKYTEEVEIKKEFIWDTLKHGNVRYEAYNSGMHKFIDEHGNEWVYTKGTMRVNFEIIEIATYKYSNGKTLTRTATPDEVIQQALSYFLPYVIVDDNENEPLSDLLKELNIDFE